MREPGAYSVFAWSGHGRYAGLEVRGGEPGLDELVVTYDTATRDHEIVNTAGEDLVVFTFFGPDLQPDAPTIPAHGR